MNYLRSNWGKVLVLAIAGGLGFWVANLAISRTPIAAQYRAALSIAYFPMLLEAWLGGLIIGFGVSFGLLRLGKRIPTRNPILKSLILSFMALILVTLIIEVPASFITPESDVWRYFIIGAIINVLRITALALVIGCLYAKVMGVVRE
jgi:hypothetical protein